MTISSLLLPEMNDHDVDTLPGSSRRPLFMPSSPVSVVPRRRRTSNSNNNGSSNNDNNGNENHEGELSDTIIDPFDEFVLVPPSLLASRTMSGRNSPSLPRLSLKMKRTAYDFDGNDNHSHPDQDENDGYENNDDGDDNNDDDGAFVGPSPTKRMRPASQQRNSSITITPLLFEDQYSSSDNDSYEVQTISLSEFTLTTPAMTPRGCHMTGTLPHGMPSIPKRHQHGYSDQNKSNGNNSTGSSSHNNGLMFLDMAPICNNKTGLYANPSLALPFFE